ncbi:MAG: PAS domain S-box protein [Candidatus Omnitrophica bacterium]|nr:PAS domain S-box protein [Candidatus Omnitrophota bacterium]
MTIGIKGKYLSIFIILAAGVFLSGLVSLWVYQDELRKIQKIFDNTASYRFKQIEDGIQSDDWVVQSLANFYAASVSVERDEFYTFTQGFFNHKSNIFEFRWLPRVPRSGLQEFEATARAAGLRDFTITEIGKDEKIITALTREEYFPVYYISTVPAAKYDYKGVFGLDAASFPERWKAMQYARDTGMPTIATGSRNYGESSILMVNRIYMPIYRNNLPHKNLEERRENLFGFVVLLFRLDELVENALKGMPPSGVDIAFYEPKSMGGRLLYFHPSRLSNKSVAQSINLKEAKKSVFYWSRPLQVVDQEWEMVCIPSPEFLVANRRIMPWVTFVLGLLLTLGLTFYLKSIINRENIVKLLVEKRTIELRNLEERYRNLYEFSADAIMTLEPPEWNFTSGNVVTIKLFGAIDEKDFISKRPWELSPERQPDGEISSVKAKKMIDVAMERGSHAFEWQHRRVGGEKFLASVLLSRVESKGRIFLQATVRDITVHREIEEKLQALSKEQMIILDSVPAWIFYKDKENCFIRVNEAYAKATGLTKEELEGKSMFELYSKEDAERYWLDDKEVFASGKPKKGIIETVNTKKGLLWVQTDKLPYYNSKGDIIGIIGFAIDITERKFSEDKISNANKEWYETFNSISDFVFILSKESVITKVNKSMLDALQLKEKDVLGRKCFEIVHKKDCPWPGCPHQRTIKDKEAHTEEVFDPGLGLPLLVSTSPIFNDKREFIGSVHIAKDISSIKNKEEELKKAKEELEVEAWGLNKANEGIKVLYKELEQKNAELRKIDQLKSDFVSIVSHELRTPLAIMKEGVSLVLDRVTGEINPKASSTLEMVYSNINRLAKLISDLLDISKIEAGRLQLKKVLADINILVKDTVDKWVPEANKKRLELSFISNVEQFNIYVDPDKIIQILSNLISNAIKFTPENGKITVQVSSNKNEVEISVSDNGVGISAVDLPKVFGKFQQFERSAGGGAKGTGLGLAICKELVELHEGLIRVESKLEKGTKFSFNMPINDSDSVFKEHINEAIKTVASRNSKLSVISVRIYDFIRLKKELGLDSTHNLLKEIERTITESLHVKSDIVFRDIGEIIIILFDINKESAQAVRVRIEEVIKSFLTGSRDEFIRNTTFNVGIAYYPEDAKDDKELLDKARGAVHV